jgi:glutamate-1-semialdehyde 2,1-aminomutase
MKTSMRDEDYAYTVPLASRWAKGVADVIADAGLGWTVTQLGCRAEYWLSHARTAQQAAATVDDDIERFLHLYALNRGLLLTPFHNMALICTSTTDAGVDTHTQVFEAAVAELTG